MLGKKRSQLLAICVYPRHHPKTEGHPRRALRLGRAHQETTKRPVRVHERTPRDHQGTTRRFAGDQQTTKRSPRHKETTKRTSGNDDHDDEDNEQETTRSLKTPGCQQEIPRTVLVHCQNAYPKYWRIEHQRDSGGFGSTAAFPQKLAARDQRGTAFPQVLARSCRSRLISDFSPLACGI